MKKNLILIIVLFAIKFTQAQNGNTTNSCFYRSGIAVIGSIITHIVVTASSTEENLATCCSLCNALPNCINWYLYTTSGLCAFFSTVTSYGNSSLYYTGKRTSSNLWACNEIKDQWYFESTVYWTKQTLAASLVNRQGCCENCFWKPVNTTLSNGECLSWMYNENTKDCYHSTKSYNVSANVYYANMYTGSVSLNFD